jgi:hypothetical protein
MRTTTKTMIGDDNNDNSGGEEKSMRAELKGERFVTHVNLSANAMTTTSTVSHIPEKK